MFLFPHFFFTFHPLLGHNKCNVDGKGATRYAPTTEVIALPFLFNTY